MKKVLLLLLLTATQAMAEGPFGKNVTGKSLILGVDDCTATKLVDKAVEESGVNFVDGNTRQLFGCEQLKEKDIYSNGGSLESFCKSGKVKCYQDGSNSVVCVANPRQTAINMVYGDAGKVIDYRARFDGLYVFSKDGAGYRREKSWKMDSDGCNPSSANLNNPMKSENECRTYIKNFASGGTIYPPDISKEKFCDGKVSSGKLGSIDELHDCIESYPQLRNMDREKPRASSPAKPATTDSATGVR